MSDTNDFVGKGDYRLDEEPQGDTRIPGTPGYGSEAAFRHHAADNADMEEIRPNQLAPGRMRDDIDEPVLDATTLRNSGDVKHDSR